MIPLCEYNDDGLNGTGKGDRHSFEVKTCAAILSDGGLDFLIEFREAVFFAFVLIRPWCP
jgi:hypothetical protein